MLQPIGRRGRLLAEAIMENGSGRRARFPVGRACRSGNAGSALAVAVMSDWRRSFLEEPGPWKQLLRELE
jgi:hypothetical protein